MIHTITHQATTDTAILAVLNTPEQPWLLAPPTLGRKLIRLVPTLLPPITDGLARDTLGSIPALKHAGGTRGATHRPLVRPIRALSAKFTHPTNGDVTAAIQALETWGLAVRWTFHLRGALGGYMATDVLTQDPTVLQVGGRAVGAEGGREVREVR